MLGAIAPNKNHLSYSSNWTATLRCNADKLRCPNLSLMPQSDFNRSTNRFIQQVQQLLFNNSCSTTPVQPNPRLRFKKSLEKHNCSFLCEPQTRKDCTLAQPCVWQQSIETSLEYYHASCSDAACAAHCFASSSSPASKNRFARRVRQQVQRTVAS